MPLPLKNTANEQGNAKGAPRPRQGAMPNVSQMHANQSNAKGRRTSLWQGVRVHNPKNFGARKWRLIRMGDRNSKYFLFGLVTFACFASFLVRWKFRKYAAEQNTVIVKERSYYKSSLDSMRLMTNARVLWEIGKLDEAIERLKQIPSHLRWKTSQLDFTAMIAKHPDSPQSKELARIRDSEEAAIPSICLTDCPGLPKESSEFETCCDDLVRTNPK